MRNPQLAVRLGAVALAGAATASALVLTEQRGPALGAATVSPDVASPVAVLVTPTSGQVASNVTQKASTDVSVTGTASCSGLKNWSLDYGSGVFPSSWTSVATSTAPVFNGVLGTWRTGSLTNGTYTVRLQVWDKAGNRDATANTVTLANFTMSQDVLEFNASAGRQVTYTSTVPFPLTETLVIRDQQARVVRTLVNQQRGPGSYTDAWDGRDDAGALVPDGPYFYVATVADGVHSMTWDLTHQYLNNYFDSKDSLTIQPFDPFNNRPMTLTYNSAVSGLVTISVFGTRLASNECDQPPENALCLVNREYKESGRHTFVWAGVDSTGVYRASAYPFLSITTIRDRFSKNAVVLFGTKPTVRNVEINPPGFGPGPAAPVVSFDLGTCDSKPADVTVTFLNQASLSTLRTIRLPAQSPGHITVPWDVRADNGAFVAPGFYTVTVTAKDGIGNMAQGQILATVRR
jgi:flagellar hook assembly protein FlgD